MRRDRKVTPSRTSPIRSNRACLCKGKNTYSIKCCKGGIHNQGIGEISAVVKVPEVDELLDFRDRIFIDGGTYEENECMTQFFKEIK